MRAPVRLGLRGSGSSFALSVAAPGRNGLNWRVAPLRSATVQIAGNARRSPRRRNLFHLEQKIACVSAAGVASGYWNSNCINQNIAADASQ